MNLKTERVSSLAIRGILVLVVALALATGSVMAQDDSGGAPVGGEEGTAVSYGFRADAALDTLVASATGEGSGTTLYAFISSRDGDGIDGERVRFVLQEGTAFLSVPGGGGSNVAVEAQGIGNGVYIARVQPGDVAGSVTVSAQWLTAPDSPVPVATIPLQVITASQLDIRVDDEFILADDADTATIIAYVLDDLNKPVDLGADQIRFSVLDGPGRALSTAADIDALNAVRVGDEDDPNALPPIAVLNFEAIGNGRYAAVYGPVANPGETVIEVSLPRLTNPIRQSVVINAVQATSLEAHVFPQQVARRLNTAGAPGFRNVTTVLVAVRDGDGDLVTDRVPGDLQATVVSGPGQIGGTFQQITHVDGSPSGVYQFTFVADEITGTSVIEITDLDSPTQARVQVTVNTVTQIGPSVIDSVELLTFADEPFYADGQGQSLILALAADEDGNAVGSGDLDAVEFLLIQGQGRINSASTAPGVVELSNGNIPDSGIYTASYVAGSRNEDSLANFRGIFTTQRGDVVTQVSDVTLSRLLEPAVVAFPPTIPQGLQRDVTVDVFDVNDEPIAGGVAARYRIEIEQGPGQVAARPVNDGTGNADLRSADNVHSAAIAVDATAGSNQDLRFSVVDELVSGFPTTDALVTIGDETQLRAVISPEPGDAGDQIQVIAFAQNEFGLPATGHDLILTVVSGSASALANGLMADDGTVVGRGGGFDGFKDAVANDGAYTGVIETTGIARGTVRIRITDLTPPSQPSIELDVPIASS